MKSQYQRSKECSHLENDRGVCLKCVFWDGAYSHCTAYQTGYDKAKMALLAGNLERVKLAI